MKLYDRVSAVVAELIANSYDADAENVTVRLPLDTLLAKADQGRAAHVIEVVDDGHGMTPDEVIDEYLKVGRDRRKAKAGGNVSRKKGRPVMGRKGIGKLAPFGICERIEVLSSGGPKTPKGHLTA
ncbi:MAG: ATP-binding protein, partial [Candidatus Methylomirabilaceae bacterium]